MNGDRAGRRRRLWLLEAAAWGLLYALAGLAGSYLGSAEDPPMAFQPAAGVALAGLLVRGWRLLPALAVGAAGWQVAWHHVHAAAAPAWLSAVLALAALVQAAAGAAWVVRRVRQPLALAEPRDIGRFFALAAAAAALAGAFIALPAHLLAGAGGGAQAVLQAVAWWFGQASGAMIVAPVLLAWAGRPRADWQPRQLVMALPVTALTVAVVLGFVYLAGLDADRARGRFELQASDAAAHLSAQLLLPTHALEAVRGLFLSRAPGEQPVDRQAFARATQAWLERPGHLHALGWSERLNYAGVPAFESRARADGFEGLRVRSAVGDGSMRPVRPDEEIVAIRFIEPHQSNRLAPGTNSRSNPATGQAIDRALRTGLPAATVAFPLRLPTDIAGADPQGVVVYRALYRSEARPVRPETAYGLVFATLRMREILASVRAAVPAGYELCLVDGDATPAPQRIAGPPGCHATDQPFTHRRALRFADRRWELRVSAPAARVGGLSSGYAWPFALFGFSGVAALCVMLLTVTGRARRVELAMAEAERARQAAVAANQAKSEFLSRMSHELRTPLNAVLGFAQLMESGQGQELLPRHRRWAGQISQAGWHLLDMINDVLDLSRIEADRLELHVEALSLPPLIEAAAALVEHAARQRGITIAPAPCAAGVSVRGDATRVKQILTNLLSNAVKYNVDQGRVDVFCRSVAGWVEIEVRDTGLGMSALQLDQLFQPFNRLGREQTELQGTGIGLVISRRLAEMMGGQLRVSSTAGRGSSFVLSLPGAQGGATAPSGLGPPAGNEAAGRDRRVHCVEDNAVNAELMAGILALRPRIRLDVSSTGQQALASVRALAPDVILLDLHLPDMSGLELLRRLKADPGCAGIPVVVVSADAMEAQVGAALQAGAVKFLAKPLHVGSFLAVLDAVLAAAPGQP